MNPLLPVAIRMQAMRSMEEARRNKKKNRTEAQRARDHGLDKEQQRRMLGTIFI